MILHKIKTEGLTTIVETVFKFTDYKEVLEKAGVFVFSVAQISLKNKIEYVKKNSVLRIYRRTFKRFK